ncbi:MAG TPA: tripartite tricarboxylate transporter substrate-binding protein, partial [Burkholderiales bacterium]|nr:tripartite tricarboxylate transporter substrate-binding protein [Burkholderiales bacterium]
MNSGPALLICLLAMPALAHSQGFPSKPIRIVASLAPGGGLDTATRVIAQNLQATLGQPGIVENRPGAGGGLGSEIVAKSPPDGHTLLTISIAHAVLASANKNLGYSPERDLIPVTIMVNAPNVLISHPSLPVKTIRELIAYAGKRPGEINYASSGSGSTSHLATEYLKLLTKIDLMHIPYKGTAPGMSDLAAGRVSMIFTSMVSAKPYVDSGRLRVLAQAGSKRAALIPNVPTIAEAGVPGYAVDVWYALMAPSATPRAVLERLNQAAVK